LRKPHEKGTVMTILLSRPEMARPRPPQAEAIRADMPRNCGCGQALDCCHAGHCPRCGIALHD
ncbi:MAG: hypothetical protein ACR2FG_08605, partial [Marmoricola sp.]